MKRLVSHIKNFSEAFSHYRAVTRWLFTDSVLRYKKDVGLIITSGFLGVSFQVSAIAFVIYYARLLEKGEKVARFGLNFDPRTSIELLVLVGTGILLSLLLSAWLIYFSGTNIMKLTRRYEEFCSKRILSLCGLSYRIWAPKNQMFCEDNLILRIACKDARHCGLALRLMMTTFIPLLTLAVAFGTILYINPALTLLVLALLGFFVRSLYKVSRASARSSTLMESTSPEASSEFKKIIRTYKGTARRFPDDGSWLENRLFKSGKTRENLDAYNWRFKAIESSTLINNIFIAVSIFLIVMVLGTSAIRGGGAWKSLIVYLLALRFMLLNFRNISLRMTKVNRLYPKISRYFQFLEHTKPHTADVKTVPEEYVIAAPGSLPKPWRLRRGSVVGLISPVKLNRYTLSHLTESLLGSSEESVGYALSSLWFATAYQKALPSSIRASFGFPPDYKWDDIRKDIENSGLWDKTETQLPHNLEKPVPSDKWNKVDQDIRFALNMLSAIHSGAQWIMIEEEGLRMLSDDACKFFLGRLSDRIVVIVYNGAPASAGRYNEEIFALVDQGKIIGSGSAEWVRANKSFITGIAGKSRANGFQGGQRDDTDDDIEDDM